MLFFRHGHALAIAGNIAFMFGGCSFYNTSDDQPIYFNDFYMLTSEKPLIFSSGQLVHGFIPPTGVAHISL
ncbi:hypothetical protein JD844_009044 [Phrynosoma platyrhinos]|uniref:Uncharacterized protein n=1 Tax=Phrynosoma platyrhinos TaxID=52577 RepID=A0ABQ7TGA1_PHRPL|nr:hypothetical protein JD844_009044 [Phrynosoma platyrhinos]